MPSKNQIGTDLVREACRKHPGLPSRTLARQLWISNRIVWPSLESIRASILRHRGRVKTPRGYCKKPLPSTAPTYPWNPEGYLPKSDEGTFFPHVIEVARDTRVGVLGDIHLPYHNMPALTSALEAGRRREWGAVLLNGDTLDFHRLSRFQKDPRARNAKKEIDAANQLLDAIDELFPKARKIWKDGNHDERYDHYLMANAGEVYELIAGKASLDKHLELADRGWEYVSEKRPIMLGQLPVIHGHEYPTPVLGPVNAARGLFLRAKDCALTNHHHQTSEHTETTIREKMITTWSVGCLCDLHPMYARFNKWNHGFAEVELDRQGGFAVHNHRIHAGKILN